MTMVIAPAHTHYTATKHKLTVVVFFFHYFQTTTYWRFWHWLTNIKSTA
jgi:hypothetical protein